MNNKSSKSFIDRITLIISVISITILPINLIVIICWLLFNVLTGYWNKNIPLTLIPKSILKIEVTISFYLALLSILFSNITMIKRRKSSSSLIIACVLGILALISVGITCFLVDTWNTFWQGLTRMDF